MSEVKRYSLAVMEAEPLFEDDQGDLVLFSDYEVLQEKLLEANKTLLDIQSCNFQGPGPLSRFELLDEGYNDGQT